MSTAGTAAAGTTGLLIATYPVTRFLPHFSMLGKRLLILLIPLLVFLHIHVHHQPLIIPKRNIETHTFPNNTAVHPAAVSSLPTLPNTAVNPAVNPTVDSLPNLFHYLSTMRGTLTVNTPTFLRDRRNIHFDVDPFGYKQIVFNRLVNRELVNRLISIYDHLNLLLRVSLNLKVNLKHLIGYTKV